MCIIKEQLFQDCFAFITDISKTMYGPIVKYDLTVLVPAFLSVP